VTWRARVTSGMAGSLFLRAFERSDRIYVAVLSRGYDGEVRALPPSSLTSGSLLALDEPTAGLDPRARRTLINLLRDLPMTMLVSSHDLAMARELLPRMVIMDEGKIVADGPTGELLKDGNLLEAHGLEGIA